MPFLLTILFITILTWALPTLAPKLLRKFGVAVHAAPVWLPIVAGLIYLSAGYLPDIHISPETDTFTKHFVGGMYTALLYVYFVRLVGWHPKWPIALAGLYAWTSSLGAINELFEFFLTKTHIQYINISDTSWDLVANTLGAFVCFGLLALGGFVSRRIKP